MITRLINSRLPLMIYNPSKVFSAHFFSKIAKAGALPVFDTEFLTTADILEKVNELIKLDILFGIRISHHDPILLAEIKGLNCANLDLIVTPLSPSADPNDFTRFSDTNIALEVMDINCNETIDAIGPHALILKGNEAGGRVSKYSSFILMQWYLKNSDLPICIHGGIGKHTAAGMFAAGVSGVVMDSQFLLADESPVSENFKKLLSNIDESDSLKISTNSNTIYRVFAKLGTKIAKELKEKAIILSDKPDAADTIYQEISSNLTALDNPDAQAVQSLFYLGQDGLFAKDFARKSTSLDDMIASLFNTIGSNLKLVDEFDPVKPGSALAVDHGTDLPLIQGPMANISDNADFAGQVLKAGALPFFAVGSLPDFLAEPMIKKAQKKVPIFGAGLVGIEAFNPAIASHMEMVKKYKVPFALFAGGVPSQVIELEKAGTKTYLHTPSVSMMENAVQNGCTRFIFEGEEAGGHIGSLSSLVLWEAAMQKLFGDKPYDLSDKTFIFAGGISTGFASLFISGLTSVLASKGAKVGMQVGTAYLFSEEIVKTESMKKQYQKIIADENETMVIGTTVGLATRTAPTEFARMMKRTEQKMIKQGKKLKDRKRSYEKKNIGSLLIGAKGFLPNFKKPGEEHYTWFEGEEHREKGNFLVGDSLAFFNSSLTINEIHQSYFNSKDQLFQNLAALEIFSSDKNMIHDDIAVIGMGCILPGARNVEQLWDNVLEKKYSIKEMPETRMRRDLYYDPDKNAEDRTYTILAGIIEDYVFDQERYGYNDEKTAKLSRSQQILLEATYQAVESSGYLGEDLRLACNDPERTAVIIATCLGNELGNDLQLKYHFPEILAMMEETDAYNSLSPEEKENLTTALQTGLEGDNPGYDPVHGILLNIEASRVAKHLGVRGTNYIIDAACASSITAIEAAQGELLAGDVDQVIVGGVNTHLAPESFIGFAKMGALSANGSCPFDERADGFILGEGSAVFVLKRMKDALRDKDNVIGIIKGIGSSSDGRGKAIAAPNPTGQALALKRCFEKINSGITPADIRYIEAHGTSTIMGDQAELETLKDIYKTGKTGISSIKSQIGHLLGCAGSAGLIKALLAVNKGVLPPNANFKKLSSNHNLDGTQLYIIAESEPWEEENNATRKAGISSYGFGGINYHMVIEQFNDGYTPLERTLFDDLDYDFNDDRIVIAGMGVCLPGAKNCDQFWEKLQSGEKQLSAIPEDIFNNSSYARFEKDSFYRLPMVKAGVIKDFNFNHAKYRMPPTTVRSIERGQLLGLDAADEAIQSSGLEPFLTKGNKAGVILGTLPGERQTKNILRVRKELIGEIILNNGILDPEKSKTIADELVSLIRERLPENNEDTTPGLLSNIISGRIANHFGLNGANYVLDASCASAVIAIKNGARSVAFKDNDFMLAGGVDASLYPAVLMAFKRLGLLSEGDCNFYDSRADGYVMGEGAAIHVITTHKKAKESNMTILGELKHCTIKGSAPDHLLAPSEQTFVSTINDAYQKSGIRKKDVNHLDLFAFSNILGDMIEKQVVEKCFSHPMSCGNVKPQFGYFKAANPAVALVKMILMNNEKTFLPDFNYSEEHSTLKDSQVLLPNQEIIKLPKGQPVKIAFNVNGIGGNHCHMILGTLPSMLTKEEDAAQAAADHQAQSAAPNPVSPLSRQYSYSADASGKKQRMVALLSGQGAQRPFMMKELFDSDPDINNIMQRGEEIFVAERGYSLLELMFSENEALNLTQNTQPAIFLSSAALFDRLHAQGFNPDYFIGHSVGEYTALFCSGMLGFDDAMKLIIKRSELMMEAGEKFPGKIMVVFKNEKETAALIRDSFLENIYITNKNSENQTAVSGTAEAIEQFCNYLKENNVIYKLLNLSGAFHTPLFGEAAEALRDYLADITFNDVPFSRTISNVTAQPYPNERRTVKDLLATQITSPVEFIKSIESVYASGNTHFIEIGPGRLLSNLLKNINIAEYRSAVTVDVKQGETASFETCQEYLRSYSSIFTRTRDERENILPESAKTAGTPEGFVQPLPGVSPTDDFSAFKRNNPTLVEKLLHDEYIRRKRDAAMEAIERFDFTSEKIVISGVSVGLPGKTKRVFASENFDLILEGVNLIEPLTIEDQERIADKNITRLFKDPDGNARFVEISKTEDVIHLAGQLGYFDLNDEYGIKEHYDVAMSLGVAAGIEALKDAGIPLVMQYKKTSVSGKMIPDGFALPKEMQDDTGIIITSLFPNNETIINELEKYYYDRFFLEPFDEFENIYYYLMEKVKTLEVKEQVTDWFFKVKNSKRDDLGPYKFDRNLLSNFCPLGAAFLAQIIRAKGPNTLLSSACAATTQAIGVAEDWIRVGRCKRVLVIGGENATSPAQNQWIGSGFFALGAATVKKRVSEAAKPFDTDRNGTIVGAGAVGIVVELESKTKARGMKGQAEILGTHMANSAYHTFNIDVPHMAQEMDRFISIVEKRHGLSKESYAEKLLFMSHETYTPARGGSADAEVTALKTTFRDHLSKICISNTKGFTGHTLGAAIEDVVMVKALQKRKAPPIANLAQVPSHFKELNFSGTNQMMAEYGLHLAAGFGSHFAFLFIKRIQENSFDNNPVYQDWLQQISGVRNPELKIIDNTLCLVTDPSDLPVETPMQPVYAPEITLKADLAHEPDPVIEVEEVPTRPQPPESETVTEPAMTGALPTDKIKEIIAEQTGYTIDMLDDELDLEADLGIDTVKQVEIFGKAASHFGFSVPEDLKLRDLNTIAKLAVYVADKTVGVPETAQQTTATAEQASESTAPDPGIGSTIKDIIAEQTGYTVDMLEDELDLEADLGIDTVKQVEIFGKAAAHFGFSVPEDLKLRDLNTIAKLTAYVMDKTGAAAEAVPGPAATPADPVGDTAAAAPETTGIGSTIKDIIAEQTGYTVDMLEDELDLEADLGIDTVKQVEIFGKAAAHFDFAVPEDLKLRDLNTIARLKEYVAAKTGADQPAPETAAQPTEEKPAKQAVQPAAVEVQETTNDEFPDPASPIKRLITRTKETAQVKGSDNDFSGKTVIVTLDSHGFALKTIEAIKEKGGNVITLGSQDFVDFKMDLTDIKAAEDRIAQFKDKYPEVNGFIHLASLDYFFKDTPTKDAELNTTFKTVFCIMKGLFDILDKPGNIIATMTFDSVIFPYMADCGPIHPSFGGLAGLLKTVNKEMPDTLVKIVDFSYKTPKRSIKKIVETFINELLSGDRQCEVGYKRGRRHVLTMKQSLPRREDQVIKPGSTLLVTGGAGGITYEIIKKVVEKYKTNLIILDINDIYNVDRKFLEPDLDQPQIIAILRQDLPKEKPLEIKRTSDRIMRVRQSVENINYLESLGVNVDYNVTDVTDADAVKKTVDQYDTIDGIFHAAGMEMSQFIAKKELWSFELVVDVKAKGMLNLIRAMENREYSYFFTFSSVTARFGNEGQVDYTAANDFLSKTLARQQQLHPDRTYKVYAWTAWSGVGMATNPTVMQVLKERGIQFLPMEQGVKFFMADLLDGQETEMVFSGLDYSFDRDGLLGDPNNGEFPFLDDIISSSANGVTYSRTLDLKRDLFLHDHAIDDVPIFLGSTGIETLAQVAAAQTEGDQQLVELTDFSIPYGIKILKGRPKELMITSKKQENGTYNCTITSLFKNPKGVVMGDPTLHYQGSCTFSDKPLKAKKITLPPFNSVELDGDHDEIVYHPKRLFMDGLFGTITAVNSFDDTTLVTTVKDSSKKEFFKGVVTPNLQTPAVLVDAMFQTGGLFEFFTTSRTVLPYNIKRLRFYKPVEKNQDYYCLTTKTVSGEETNTYQLQLCDKKGNLYITVEDFQMVKLNRLEDQYKINNRIRYSRKA